LMTDSAMTGRSQRSQSRHGTPAKARRPPGCVTKLGERVRAECTSIECVLAKQGLEVTGK
jgi:hypothetical protein